MFLHRFGGGIRIQIRFHISTKINIEYYQTGISTGK